MPTYPTGTVAVPTILTGVAQPLGIFAVMLSAEPRLPPVIVTLGEPQIVPLIVPPVIGYGYGPGYRGLVCTLILSKAGVKLGIVRGSELDDPHGLLEGSGRVHRYVQLRNVSDLRKAGVGQIVKAAHIAWKRRTASSRDG